jgi:adenylate kinase
MEDRLERSGQPVLIVVGRQGSGKGEQCSRLARRLGLEHVSTGELLRAAMRDGTRMGRVAESYVVRGELVPDDLVAGLVAERLALAGAEGRGVVLDGFPRTVEQAERLAALIGPAPISMAIHLDVPRSVAIERIQRRRVCTSCHTAGPAARCARCGGETTRRRDDRPEAIGRRMSDYARRTEPLLRWFEARGVLATVNGLGTPEQVAERIFRLVDADLLASS